MFFQLFNTLRELKPDFHNKVVAIPGDILHDGLGISQSDGDVLKNNVSVVFHVAATVRFDEPLK